MGFTAGVGWTVFLKKGGRIMAKTAAEKAYELGKEYEKTYKGCSQCAIAALQDALDIRNDDIFKAATGLAAGGGLAVDGSCGAYVGAILILGLLLGRERDNFEDLEGIQFRNFELARKFRDRYIQEYGTVLCRDIQTKVLGRPYYLADLDELNKFEDAGGHADDGCPQVVGKAAQWMVELIQEENLLHHPV
jgi:C_GCAxxG_C_C family probable redox protein